MKGLICRINSTMLHFTMFLFESYMIIIYLLSDNYDIDTILLQIQYQFVYLRVYLRELEQNKNNNVTYYSVTVRACYFLMHFQHGMLANRLGQARCSSQTARYAPMSWPRVHSYN